ncbi:hypothetical protein [Sneathiella chinensis]|uniref:hypothetical protein n=1 Tax=Sneathiella chinensis TaxID=349750 RepID=UPI001469F2F4|nr:hypothetical protein [Sneathiella chinensis]
MLSPVKIILLLAVVGAVFLVARLFRSSPSNGGEDNGKPAKKGDTGKEGHTDLVKCPDCGTFVASLESHHCEK